MDPVWRPQETLPHLREILAAYNGGKPVAQATLLKPAKGSNLLVGAKLLVREDGTRMGTLGSPRLDDEAAKSALPLMAYGKEHYLKTADGAEVFLEAYTTPPKLVLMGGGHVNKAVSSLAQSVGFRIYVIDDRPEFANPERFPMAEATIAKDYAEGLGDVPINTNTFIVVGTRGHREDDRALEAAARTPAGYVALMGSKRKVILIYEELLKRGVPLARLRQIHSPVGLDIHARTPEEIAVSIVAELIQFRLGGTGGSMKLEERRLMKIVEKVRKQQEAAVAVAS
jgi:xanthine dehydrogenase accessory factor